MKILIIQLKQLGDVLLSTPLAENVKHFYPDCTVHFLTTKMAKEIVINNPYIDKTLILYDGILNEFKMIKRVANEKYDAILDVQRTARSKRISLFSKAKTRVAFKGKHNKPFYNLEIVEFTNGYTAFERLDLLKAIGIEKPKKILPRLYFPKEIEEKITEYLKRRNIDRYFVVSPTARKITKMWDLEEFGKLSETLSKRFNLKAIVTYGTPPEKQFAIQCAKFTNNSHVLEKPFSIMEFAALVKNAEFSLGNDSFASHVAVSQNTKTVVVCGPTSGWFPEIENVLLIYKGLDCQPCNNPDKCPYDLACYKTLKHSEIVDKVIKFLKG